MTRKFSDSERARFRNLLELAAKSPYEGERANAQEAAERMAARYGMSVDEAARDAVDTSVRDEEKDRQDFRDMWSTKGRRWTHEDSAREMRHTDQYQREEKLRREEAIRAARERGLDDGIEGEKPKRRMDRIVRRKSGPKREPYSHARVLLSETSISAAEIAKITGLSIYEIIGMKLKMRSRQQRYG